MKTCPVDVTKRGRTARRDSHARWKEVAASPTHSFGALWPHFALGHHFTVLHIGHLGLRDGDDHATHLLRLVSHVAQCHAQRLERLRHLDAALRLLGALLGELALAKELQRGCAYEEGGRRM